MATDPNAPVWCRNRVTGLVEKLPARLVADADYLEEVPEGTKPLAYTPIPREAIEQLNAQRAGGTSANKKR